MIDINKLRENPEFFKKATADKQMNPDLIEQVLQLDEEWRSRLTVVEKLRAEKNALSKMAREDSNARVKAQRVKQDLQKAEPELKEIETKRDDLLKQIPNPASKDTIVGKDESENKVIRKWGEIRNFDFEIRDHLEIGKIIKGIDTEKAAEVVGSRFTYLFADVALLQFALIQFAFSVLTDEKILKEIADKVQAGFSEKPFIPVVPPVMIKPEVFEKMARLKPEDERFYIESDNWYLIGSAEHTLGPLHMNETIPAKNLPIRYVGYSTSFRREAGSYGKDTRGILRVHQFEKIEMESFSLPENSELEQLFFVYIQEYLLQQLNLPYQVVEICTGDMGGPDYKQFDIETWIPSQDKYRETHTSDLMTDYQSRRLNTKFQNGSVTDYVHMNDATVFAIGRTLIAILENYQNADGSVNIPEVLQKYMGGKEKIAA